MSITLLLADDSEVMRRAIKSLLEADPEIQLVGEATSFTQAITLTSKLQPQVVIMDLHMSDEESLMPFQFKSCLGESRLLVVSFRDDDEARFLAASYGAASFLGKMNLSYHLIPAIKRCVSDLA
jgi:two-component system, NarL family, response regulator DevR